MFEKHVDEAVEAEIWLKADAKVLELQKKRGCFFFKSVCIWRGRAKICRGRGGLVGADAALWARFFFYTSKKLLVNAFYFVIFFVRFVF